MSDISTPTRHRQTITLKAGGKNLGAYSFDAIIVSSGTRVSGQQIKHVPRKGFFLDF